MHIVYDPFRHKYVIKGFTYDPNFKERDSMFDFDKAVQDAQKDLDNKKLFLILLGSSGNGKSYCQGTFGVKTLYLYTQGESHGPRSAASLGGDNIVPVCIDRDGEKELTADESLKRLHDILGDLPGLKKAKFGAISLDGATELEGLIRSSAYFKERTLKPFTDGPVETAMFRDILNKLKAAQRTLGLHVCVTCILNVKEYGEDGVIIDSTPILHGYQVATSLVQQFDDVMIVGRMQRKDKHAYRLQLLAGASKKTTDFNTQEVKKTFNFSPRLTGVDILALGATLDANLAELAAIKAKGK